jgi:formylmethanofuran dehydrogenase subunit D
VVEVFGERADRGAEGGSDRPTVRLPPRRSSFVGRAAELGEIAARLGRYSVVTLVGVGGVGKTALAVEAAWAEVSAGRAELACYVDLVPCRTGDQVIAALVEGVGIRGAPAAAGLDAVVDAVSGGRSLLVIDNCEHVLESAGDQPAQRRVQGEQAVTVHPRDAAERGITDGQEVRVYNDRGQFIALAQVRDDIAPGVVMAPMGAWRKNARGQSTVNAVNPFVFADLGNAPTFSDTKVEIQPATAGDG